LYGQGKISTDKNLKIIICRRNYSGYSQNTLSNPLKVHQLQLQDVENGGVKEVGGRSLQIRKEFPEVNINLSGGGSKGLTLDQRGPWKGGEGSVTGGGENDHKLILVQ